MKKSRYILSILVVLIIFLIATISALVLIGGDKKTSSDNTSITTQPITIINTQSVNVTTDPYKDWKSYYYEPWDITIKYPSNYEVEENPAAGNLTCEETKDFLKSTYKCNSTVKFPSITLHKVGSTENEDYLNMFGPATVGGECAPGSQALNYNLTIKNQNYNYLIKKEPDGKFCSREDTLYPVTAIGSKSIWAKYAIKISADNEEIFSELLRITSTIS